MSQLEQALCWYKLYARAERLENKRWRKCVQSARNLKERMYRQYKLALGENSEAIHE